ncbi:oxidoreductase [Virgisporangium aliadipatigenens]|uniref:Oxidoreductase n=1 Tax=Virgisporangium aliadipatigenens TaxID=741659 RepID=A0A8J4DT87_9ACTN|nr:aldo/keto reductase [Virgisporangium aliadipatigenens]GIJ49524.1 oxidoreductase [Virgisporangium aliadipatigenens]
MKLRQLGTNGPQVAAVGLGTMSFADVYGPADDNESIAAVHRALDVGMTHFDTADMYGAGHSERVLGQALKGRRDEAFVATKFLARFPEGADRASWLGPNSGQYGDTSPEWVPQACDASLARLGIDTIDLYYMHRKLPDVPIEDTVGAMAGLVRAGKVRHLGLSEVAVDTLRRAHAVHPIAAVQVEYSLFTRDPENGLLDACRELGVALVAYSPYGRGILTGTVQSRADLAERDYRRFSPRYSEENLDHNAKLVDVVRTVADEVGASPAKVALAWVLSRGEDVFAIPGTRRVKYVEENADAADLTLSPEALARLDDALPPGAAAGTRYPEQGMRSVNN